MKQITLFFVIVSFAANAQDSSAPAINWSGYAEAYYTYDFNHPADHNRPAFIYSHNRHNEINLNLGYLKGNYSSERVRANLALAAGTYMNANYAAEPGVLKNIYEANAGVKLSKKENLWFDIGIMPSHIGFESAVSKDCRALTRSILADNSPYFESGAKLTYSSKNNQWLFSAMVLNGWQRITMVDGNSLLSFGTQIQFKPSDRLLLNYSTFAGTDKPDSARLYRVFHNLYSIINLNDHVGLTLGVDIGQEEKANVNDSWNYWFSPVAILGCQLNSRWAGAFRAEYYQDKNGVIISSAVPGGFEVYGFSLNLDYMPVKVVVLRLELRTLQAKEELFLKEDKPTKNNTFITFSTAVAF